jgi:hypothetical protein
MDAGSRRAVDHRDVVCGPRRAHRRQALSVLSLVVLLLLLPLRHVPSWEVGGVDGPRANLFDAVLGVAAVLCLPAVLARRRISRLATVGVAALLALLVMALIVHPSRAGAVAVARVVAAAVVGLAIATAAESRDCLRILTGVLVAGAVAQALVAVAQLLHGGPVGLGFLGEAGVPLKSVGGSLGPRGTFQHAYPLAGFAVLAAFAGLAVSVVDGRRRGALAWVAVAAVPVGITYSRSALVAVALGVGSLCRGRTATTSRHRALLGAGALAVVAGALVPALVWPAGWQARLASTKDAVARGSADEVSSSRLYLAGSALRLIESSPMTGIGPGRYSPESVPVQQAASRQADQVHNLPLYVGVLSGAPAGLLVVALLMGTGIRAFRCGVVTRTLYLAYLPFVLLDRFPHDGPQGLALTATWLGLVSLLGRCVSQSQGVESLG